MRKRKRVRTDGSPRLGPKSGSPFIHIHWTEAGRSRRLSTGTTDAKLAEGFLINWLATREPKPNNPTVNDVCDAYYKDRLEKPVARPENITQRLKPIRAFFGAGDASSVTHARIRAYIAKRRGEAKKSAPGVKTQPTGTVSDATIDTELRAFRHALKWAHKRGWIDREIYVETPGGNQPRRRFLQPSEIERLVAALEDKRTKPHVRTLVLIALYTAQRGGAIRELKWEEHVDFERSILWFPPGRSRLKNRVSVPMVPALWRHLAMLKATPALSYKRDVEWPRVYVVEWKGKPIDSARTAFNSVIERAGLEDVTFHDLRRTAASLALQRGASFSEVAALLGDDEAVVRQHYAMFGPDFLANIVQRLEHIANAPVALTGPDEADLKPSDLTE